MTSLSRKLFIKLGAGAFLVVVLLALVVGAMLYYTAFRIEETPTCMNFRASVPARMAGKIRTDLQDVIGPDLKIRIKDETAIRWESDRATVSYYSGREGEDHSIFVCSNNHDAKLWQDIAVKVEKVLERDSAMFSVWLQMNDRDFRCNPNCITDVPLPIDFERLNRTLLNLNAR
ncbi:MULTISPECIES: hypothetical protein [unclassified Herbaspirillum]|nr:MULTISPECIES: hypothetical protein [unclassified Herbaspirillum]|tara:strand:- start:5385 stop:5906 length:522 start_codon:yes stop_codon:yes gene_type:complete